MVNPTTNSVTQTLTNKDLSKLDKKLLIEIIRKNQDHSKNVDQINEDLKGVVTQQAFELKKTKSENEQLQVSVSHSMDLKRKLIHSVVHVVERITTKAIEATVEMDKNKTSEERVEVAKINAKASKKFLPILEKLTLAAMETSREIELKKLERKSRNK